ncbi:hypothetical protein Y032_0668g1350 [Ancylostoma ceylanicum]|uniref:Uncharacterized protein n=1 Tax=Ancylostoma ceylanicum TaxID=53326 RepID=A0A016WHV2_9BILA|nr:hypothetical protein Y032_0668g1350 [Ancylostoma ceylanicum]
MARKSVGKQFYGCLAIQKARDSVGKTDYGCLAILMARFVWRHILRVNMFISFLVGDSIITGVDSDGAVGKAVGSQYQNRGTIPGVIKIFARSSLFGDTKVKVCMAIHFTGLLVWRYILRDFLFGNTFDGVRLPG